MISNIIDKARTKKILKPLFLFLAIIPYAAYIGYIINIDRGPIDYETFMDIGSRLLSHQTIYGENSFYPMPYVMIFAFFSWLPRPLSMLLWFSIPLLFILYIAKWDARMLLFAPTFSHFLGGQTALPGLLGFWGYRRNHQPESIWGGVLLAVAFLKPQLAIFPFLWAAYQWLKWIFENHRIPRQVWSFFITLLALYLPSFFLMPDWPVQWLQTPRPLFERALAGLIPRTLFYFVSSSSALFWLILGSCTITLLIILARWNKNSLPLDYAITSSFIINPLIHDYDLIQLVPVLENKYVKKAALLISIPGWFVILFGYQNDHLWYAFTLIAPVILFAMIHYDKNRDKYKG